MTSPVRRAISTRGLVIASVAAVAALGAAGFLASAHGSDQPRGKGSPSKPGESNSGARQTSDLVEVVKGDFDITTTCAGELRARNQIEVRNTLESETSITEIIPEGTVVKQGDVLVKLNSEPIQTRVDEEALALESARAAMVEAEQSYQIQLSENESAKRQAELKHVLAKLDLEQWRKGEVESKRQDLDHALDRCQKDETRLEDKFHQSKVLKEKGYYSADQLRQDELAYEQAVAALEKAKLDKKVYWEFQYPKDEKKKMSDVEEAVAEKERVLRQNESKIASKEADRNNKKQSLTIRQQKHVKATEQLAASTIRAPSAGLVVYSTSMDGGMRWGGDDGPLQVGKKVYPNALLIALPDTSEMIASVKVHESLASRIQPGQAATIKIDAAGERRFTGKVDSIGILAEQTSRWMDPNLREYTVKIAMDLSSDESKTHGLKPSMRAEAEIYLGTVTDAITVPIQAVFSDGLVRYVHTPEGNRFVRHPVSIGRRSDRFAEVKIGVQPGQRVLIRKPEPAEVLARNWDAEELASVGLKFNDQGVIIPANGPVEGRPAGGPPPGAPIAAAKPQPPSAAITETDPSDTAAKDAETAPATPAVAPPESAAQPAPAGA